MLLLVMGVFSDPFFQPRPSGSQAEDVHPICHPILLGGTHSGFENPTPSNLRLLSNAMDSLQEEATWGIPFLNSVSGTGQETNASPFWRFDKLPLLVQKAGNTAVSLFSGKITIQLPFTDLFLQDCEEAQESVLVPSVLDNQQIKGASVQQSDTPADTVQTQNDKDTEAEPGKSADDLDQARIFVGTVIDREGANLRSGPGLDYAIVDKWAKGQQFPFEMVSADGEWVQINEGLWISASIVAGHEISETPSPA